MATYLMLNLTYGVLGIQSGILDRLGEDNSILPVDLTIATPTKNQTFGADARLNVDPETAQDFYDLGVQAQTNYQLDQAIAYYQTAIQRDANFDSAYINLGLAYIETQQLDQAQAILQAVLDLPDRSEVPVSIHTLAHYNLGIVFSRQEDIANALEEVEQALEITPDFELAQQLLQQLQQ